MFRGLLIASSGARQPRGDDELRDWGHASTTHRRREQCRFTKRRGPDLLHVQRVGGPVTETVPSMITKLFDQAAGRLSPGRDDHPAFVEQLASGVTAMVRLIAADGPMTDGPFPIRPSDLLGEIPPSNSVALLTASVLTLAESQRFQPRPGFVDCIRAVLPFCAPDAHDALRRHLARMEAEVGAPEWADALWNARPVGGWLGRDTLDDELNLGVELSWPGDWPDRVLFVNLIAQDGPHAVDFAVNTLMRYEQVFASDTPWLIEEDDLPGSDDVIRYLEAIDAAKAIGLLKQAMDRTDALEDPDIAEDYVSYLPLVDQRFAGLESTAPPDSTLSDERRQGVIEGSLRPTTWSHSSNSTATPSCHGRSSTCAACSSTTPQSMAVATCTAGHPWWSRASSTTSATTSPQGRTSLSAFTP